MDSHVVNEVCASIVYCMHVTGSGNMDQSILCRPSRVAGQVSLLQQDTGLLTLSGS